MVLAKCLSARYGRKRKREKLHEGKFPAPRLMMRVYIMHLDMHWITIKLKTPIPSCPRKCIERVGLGSRICTELLWTVWQKSFEVCLSYLKNKWFEQPFLPLQTRADSWSAHETTELCSNLFTRSSAIVIPFSPYLAMLSHSLLWTESILRAWWHLLNPSLSSPLRR